MPTLMQPHTLKSVVLNFVTAASTIQVNRDCTTYLLYQNEHLNHLLKTSSKQTNNNTLYINVLYQVTNVMMSMMLHYQLCISDTA